MKNLLIWGGYRLEGTVKCDGAKNAALPIMAGAMLAEGKSTVYNVPSLSDVKTMAEMLESLGAEVDFNGGRVQVRPRNLQVCAPYDLVRKMRASFLLAGPLLARCGRFEIPLPGGCAIGERPIDLHLKGFKALGAKVEISQGTVKASSPKGLEGAKVYLDVPSVGATENIMMAASLARGETIIENAAEEPEIVDLANFLVAMGAEVKGAGTTEIRIEGKKELRSANYTVIPDRIEAATYLIAGAITRGHVRVENVIPTHIKSVTSKLREQGAAVTEGASWVELDMPFRPRSVNLKTLPYPGFPTDAQAPFMSLAAVSSGTSMISESVFERRFGHVEELRRMGARIFIQGPNAVVEGVERLGGTRIQAMDLRAGAALCLAGLTAEGVTQVYGMEHVERGYSDLPGKLSALGAKILRSLDKEESVNF